jgi:hypothetical protein
MLSHPRWARYPVKGRHIAPLLHKPWSSNTGAVNLALYGSTTSARNGPIRRSMLESEKALWVHQRAFFVSPKARTCARGKILA